MHVRYVRFFRQENKIHCINYYEIMTTYPTFSTNAHLFSLATRPCGLSEDHKSLARFHLDGRYLRTAKALPLCSGLIYGVVRELRSYQPKAQSSTIFIFAVRCSRLHYIHASISNLLPNATTSCPVISGWMLYVCNKLAGSAFCRLF